MFPVDDWEMPGRFETPVLFITGLAWVKDRLLATYGITDERVGTAWFSLSNCVTHTRQHNAVGERAKHARSTFFLGPTPTHFLCRWLCLTEA